MNIKHIVIGAVLALGMTTAWANAAEQKTVTSGLRQVAPGHDRPADYVTVKVEVEEHIDDEQAMLLSAVVDLGKATYTVADTDGQLWTVKVSKASKARKTKGEKHASKAPADGSAFYAD